MATSITLRVTSQDLLIPPNLVHEWLDQDIQIIKDQQRIIIQRQPTPQAERERVLQILEACGLLAKPQWEPTSPPVSSAELERGTAAVRSSSKNEKSDGNYPPTPLIPFSGNDLGTRAMMTETTS